MKNLLYLLFSLTLIMTSCEKQLFELNPETDPESVFEQLWSDFDQHYAIFPERGVNWADQYELFRPMVSKNTTDQELFDVFREMLIPLDDGHVQLSKPNEQIFFSNTYYRTKLEDELFDLELIERDYITSGSKKMSDGHLTLGWIGDLGYVHLRHIYTFLYTNEFLDYFADAKGLILDLRHNGGGNMNYVFSQFGRFTREERITHRSKTRNGPGKDDYTDWYEWIVYPEGEYYDKPLVLLTDRYTMSAAERATMAFKTLPNLVHIGDTTNGSISTMIGRELANGWMYTVSPQKVEFVDGISYEAKGLVPDILVENTAEEMAAGQDKALEAAINHLK